jgi:hypothetical protein
MLICGAAQAFICLTLQDVASLFALQWMHTSREMSLNCRVFKVYNIFPSSNILSQILQHENLLNLPVKVYNMVPNISGKIHVITVILWDSSICNYMQQG